MRGCVCGMLSPENARESDLAARTVCQRVPSTVPDRAPGTSGDGLLAAAAPGEVTASAAKRGFGRAAAAALEAPSEGTPARSATRGARADLELELPSIVPLWLRGASEADDAAVGDSMLLACRPLPLWTTGSERWLPENDGSVAPTRSNERCEVGGAVGWREPATRRGAMRPKFSAAAAKLLRPVANCVAGPTRAWKLPLGAAAVLGGMMREPTLAATANVPGPASDAAVELTTGWLVGCWLADRARWPPSRAC